MIPLSASNLSDFCLLQVQCANWRLSLSDGCPPFDTGIMWSMHLDNGCGYFKVLSTGLPQIPQISWVAYIHALFFSNCFRWVPSLSGLCAISKTPRAFQPWGGVFSAVDGSMLCVLFPVWRGYSSIKILIEIDFLFSWSNIVPPIVSVVLKTVFVIVTVSPSPPIYSMSS